jgi:hypothetical protein
VSGSGLSEIGEVDVQRGPLSGLALGSGIRRHASGSNAWAGRRQPAQRSKEGQALHVETRVLQSSGSPAGTARPHLLRISGTRKSVVAVTGEAVRRTQCSLCPDSDQD